MKIKVKGTEVELKIASFVSFGMGLTAWTTTYMDARIKHIAYGTRKYPLGYWILIIAPIIFAAMYCGSVWGKSWRRKIVVAETGLIVVSGISLFNFLPEFPHGNMQAGLVFYFIASAITYWIHYAPINSDYVSDTNILDNAKIERAKESINSWRNIVTTLAAGYMVLIIGWCHLILLDLPPTMVSVSSPGEMRLVIMWPLIQLTFFSFFIIFGLLYEGIKKTEKAADVLLSIKKNL
ncbi:MAG: hypothetical protein NTX59_14385 [Elusimicrobia bacterium]|nr:hypothetical protein [Elusimicrobiota bacterium]